MEQLSSKSISNSLSTKQTSELTVVPKNDTQLLEALKYWDQDRKRMFWGSIVTKIIVLILGILSLITLVYVGEKNPDALKYLAPSLLSTGGLLLGLKKVVSRKNKADDP